MRCVPLFLCAFLFGCASKAIMPVMESSLVIDSDHVTLFLNDVDARHEDVVGRYPDELEVKALFVEEINAELFAKQEKAPLPLLADMKRIEVNVTYNRHYSAVKGGIGMPGGSFAVSALTKDDDVIWQEKMDDVVVQGTVFLNIFDIYKVPVGQFKQKEERKYLRIWAKSLADRIYSQHREEYEKLSKSG